MKLIDTMNGPVWVVWAVVVLCAAISLLLLSGHGSWLIAGYNTASKKEKEKYDEKKLCRVMGCGMSLIALMTFVLAAGIHILPASFAGLYGAVVLADCLVMIILCNTVCKKKKGNENSHDKA